MKFAAIGDIHGNKYALEAAIKDIKSKDVDFIISTGDLVGYMMYPNEVIDIIRENNIVVVKGNHDEVIANSKKVTTEKLEEMTNEEVQKAASRAFTNWKISDDNRKYLKSLMDKMVIECEGKKIIVVHGSPFSINEYTYDNEESLKKLGETISEDIVICGHTHLPYFKEVNDKYFINVGSVGKPKHGEALGTYVIIEISNGVVNCDIQKVRYNVENMIKDIEGNEMISNDLIKSLREGI